VSSFPIPLAIALLVVSAMQPSAAAESLPTDNHAGAAKVGKPIAPRNLLGRRSLSSPPSERVVPNAIGVQVPRPEGAHGVGSAGLVGGTPAAGGSASGLARSSGRFRGPTVPQTYANRPVDPGASNRSAINGTNLRRSGSGPLGIGGPGKAVAGVSGTTIHPRR
jgi:hypothetical protein